MGTQHLYFLAQTCQPLLSGKGCYFPSAVPGSPRCRGPAQPLWGQRAVGHTAHTRRGHLWPWAAWLTRRAVASARWTVTMTAAGAVRTVPTLSPAVAQIAQAPVGGTETAARLTSGWLEHTGPRVCAGLRGTMCRPGHISSKPITCSNPAVCVLLMGQDRGGTQLLPSLPGPCATSGTCPSRTGTRKPRRPCSPTVRPEARSPGLGGPADLQEPLAPTRYPLWL